MKGHLYIICKSDLGGVYMAGSETYIMDDFWHKNLDRILHIAGSFIEAFASANLSIKVTQARGHKCFLCFVKKFIASE